MSTPKLTQLISPAVYELVAEAKRNRLTMFVGAGLSVGSGLPSGAELARRLHCQFKRRIDGYHCTETENLGAVAMAMASLPDGLKALQLEIVESAPFDSAPPTCGHRLLALLLAEGTIRLLTTNWDDCLERGWQEERRILAARDASEAEELHRAHVLKVHGCCSRPATLLVTEDQLQDPPLWTKSAFSAEIATSTMVFVGVGDVAPYVREPIKELSSFVDGARVRVVTPNIDAGWETSQWKDVLPGLAADRRLAMTADAFADELARGWLSQLVSDLGEPGQPEWVEACHTAFGALTAVEALCWLRRAAMDWRVGWSLGESIVRSAEARAGLKAVAILAKQHAESSGEGLPSIRFEPQAAVSLHQQRIEVLIGRPNQPTTELERAARERARRAAAVSGVDRISVLCSASMPEGERRSELEFVDVLAGEPDPDDIIAGPSQVQVELLWADELLRVA